MILSRFCCRIFLLAVFSSSFSPDALAQVAGGNRSDNAPSPTEVRPGLPFAGNVGGDVNLFTGTYGSSYTFGTVKTPSGLSYTLSLGYSSTVSSGDNVPVASGIPYGEGWSLNIPTVSISTEAYNKYDPTVNHTNIDFSQSAQDPAKEGRLYWFAPYISIPGVVSDRFVFKYKDNDGLVFVPHTFEKYIEARLIGATMWEVVLEDGTRYRFENAAVNTRNASNQRVAPYAASGGSVYSTANNNNLILPKTEVLTWYCGEIYHPNHAARQSIFFTYEQYGKFDFFQEFNRQEPLRQILSSYTMGIDTLYAQWLNAVGIIVNHYPSFNTYRDILLKEVTAIEAANNIEKLVLDYSTVVRPGGMISPLSVKNMLIAGADTAVARYDSLYNYKTVYERGGTNSFSAWRRFHHVMSDAWKALHPGGWIPYMEEANPYLGGQTQTDLFYSSSPVGNAPATFGHNYFQSERISQENIPAGDLYEIKATIEGPSTAVGSTARAVNFDINIATGDNMLVTSGGNAGDYTRASYESYLHNRIFSTFNQPVKWNYKGGSLIRGRFFEASTTTMVTSNFFVMSNIPDQFGGFNIQVGPGNADMKYSATEGEVNNASQPRATNAYYNALWNQNHSIKAFAKLPGSFGIGMPWYMVKPVYDNIAGGANYQFWYNTNPGSTSFPWPNQPTLAGSSFKLKGVELVRYSKNPYMLTGVNYYRYNGDLSDSVGAYGEVPVERFMLRYTVTVPGRIVNNRRYGVGEPVEYKEHGDHNVFLLSSIRQVPVKSDGSPVAHDVSKLPAVHYSYTTLSNPVITDFFRLSPDITVLTRVVDPLGKITVIGYNDTLRPRVLSDYTPFYVNEIINPATQTKLGTPLTLQIPVRVSTKSIRSEANTVKTWTYSYSGYVSRWTQPEALTGQFADNIIISRFRSESGYTSVKVTEPQLGGNLHYSVHYFHGNDKLWGRKYKTETYNASSVLLNKEETFYKVSMAFENGVYTGFERDRETNLTDYCKGCNYNVSYAGEFDSHGKFRFGADDCLFLEGVSPGDFSRDYLASYFVRKTRDISTRYNIVPAGLVQGTLVSLLGLSFPIGASNPNNRIELYTDYEYYDADSMGRTTSDGFKALKDVSSTLIPLDYEPSWQLYSRKVYSPQLPDAYTKEEYFYYYDLVNYSPLFLDNSQGSYNLPVFKELQLVFGRGMRTLYYQHRTTGKSQGLNALRRSKFYIYDAYWNRTPEATETVSDFEELNIAYLTPCATVLGGQGNTGTGSGPVKDVVPAGCRLIHKPPFKVPPTYVVRQYNGYNYACPCDCPGSTGDFSRTGTSPVGTVEPDTAAQSTFSYIDVNGTDQPPGYMITDLLLDNKLYLRAVHTQIDTLILPHFDLANLPEKGSHTLLRFKLGSTWPSPNFPKAINHYHPELPFSTIREKEVNNRTYYGEEKTVTLSNSLTTRYYYGLPRRTWHYTLEPGYTCHNHMTTVYRDIGRVIASTVYNPFRLQDSLRTEYRYNPNGSLDSVIHPNGDVLHYTYDGFGRIKETFRNADLVSFSRYHNWENNNTLTFEQRAAENYTETYSFVDSGLVKRTTAYIDPLGRPFVTAEQSVTDTLASTLGDQIAYGPYSRYDNWGRPIRTYKPFNYLNPASLAPRFNPDTGAYRSFRYEDDPRSRLLREAPEGQSISSGRYKRFFYEIIDKAQLLSEVSLGSVESSIMPCSACSYFFEKIITADEDNKTTVTYFDALGRKISVKQHIDQANYAGTRFVYDSYFNVSVVADPNDYQTTYKYNMLGWLYRKTTPDAGMATYVYNSLGKMIYEEDANLRAGSDKQIREYKYDDYGRRVLQQRRVISGSLSATARDNERFSHEFLSHYDNSVALSSVTYPEKSWSYGPLLTTNATHAPRALPYLQTDRTFLKGRLSHTTTYSHEGLPVKYCFYSYNSKGQIKWEMQQFNPNGITAAARGLLSRIDYRKYSLQDGIVTQNIDVNSDTTLDLQYHYTYDAYGRMSRVYANFTDAGEQGFLAASYWYDDALGLVKKTTHHDSESGYQNITVDEITHTYDLRDRLTGISGALFDQTLYYDNAGASVLHDYNYNGNINQTLASYKVRGANVTNAASISNFPMGTPTAYGYRYDGLSRLTHADGLLLLPNARGAYPGDENYTYDKSGNILTLQRTNFGVAQDHLWTYHYTAGTNKLHSVTGPVPALETRSYAYDASGNVVLDNARSVQDVGYGRSNLPFALTTVWGGATRNARFLYNHDNERIFKVDKNTGLSSFLTADYYLRDHLGRELGVLNLSTGAWTWYVHGLKREARITPAAGQQPKYYPGGIGDYSSVDTSQAATRQIIRAIKASTLPDNLLEIQKPSGVREYLMQTVFDSLRPGSLVYQASQVLKVLPLKSVNEIIGLPPLNPAVKDVIIAVKTIKGIAEQTGIAPGGNFPPVTTQYIRLSDTATHHIVYYAYDHLNNTRVTYDPHIGPLGELSFTVRNVMDYFPSGKLLRIYSQGEVERYLTTGNERDVETGYDHRNKRVSDCETVRFLSIDPLADKFPEWSPYVYVEGNPALKTDPNGDCVPCLMLAGALLYSSFAEAPTADNSIANRQREAESRANLSSLNASIVTAPFAGYTAVKVYNFLKPSPYYRYVDDTEAQIAKDTKQLPNTNKKQEPKDIYYTKDKYNTGSEAKDKLQLEKIPTHRIRIDPKNVKDGSEFKLVKPEENPHWGSGGGSEATTPNAIRVKQSDIKPIPEN